MGDPMQVTISQKSSQENNTEAIPYTQIDLTARKKNNQQISSFLNYSIKKSWGNAMVCHQQTMWAAQHFGICGQAILLVRIVWRNTIQHIRSSNFRQIMEPIKKRSAELLRALDIPTQKYVHLSTKLVINLPKLGECRATAVFTDKLLKTACKK